MSNDLILCQREIRRLRCVVRTYEAQMRELKSYLEQMAGYPKLGDEARQTVREISKSWQRILED